MATLTHAGDQKSLVKEDLKKPNGPVLDEEGNIVPPEKPKVEYCQPSPIARLAKAAAFKPKDKIPTAGGYAISRSKEPTVDFPPACLLYDEDRPWVLGKLNKAALEVAEPAEPVPIDLERLEKILEDLDVNVPEKTDPAAPENAEVDIKTKKATSVSEQGDKHAEIPVADLVEKTIASVFKPKGSKKRSKSGHTSQSPSARKSTPSSPRTQSANRAKTPTPKSPARGGDASTAAATAEKLISSPRSGPKKTVNAKMELEIVDRKL